MAHRWEQPARPTQNVLSVPEPPVVAIRVTSSIPAEDQRVRPWFLTYEPTRDEFINETIVFLFGTQYDGTPHAWEKLQCRLVSPEENLQSTTAQAND